MYHIGKVEEVIRPKAKKVISADDSAQAAVRMWDGNFILLRVDRKIQKELKEGDYVISDYSPIQPDAPHRRMLIIKILRGEEGKRLYDRFCEFFDSRKKNMQGSQQAPPVPYHM